MKTRVSALVMVIGLGAAALTLLAAKPSGYSAEDQARIERGLAIAPVPLNLAKADKSTVGMGSYIVNGSGGCANCHSCPTYFSRRDSKGGKILNSQNYLAGGTPFPEYLGQSITSPNLTPDAQGLPGGLTRQQFKEAFTHQVGGKYEGHLGGVMPWAMFANLVPHDVEAIYAYLKTIPPAKAGSCKGPEDQQK